MDVEELITRCRCAKRPVVVQGQIADAHRERVGVLDVAGRTRMIVDQWLAPTDLTALTSALGVSLGAWDVLHATRWKYAWLEGTVWDKRSWRARVVAPRTIELRTMHGSTRINVARVRATLSPSWLVRAVLVVDERNREHVVAHKHDLSVALDSTYDAIDLLFDASWAAQMARSLAQALAVDLDVDQALS